MGQNNLKTGDYFLTKNTVKGYFCVTVPCPQLAWSEPWAEEVRLFACSGNISPLKCQLTSFGLSAEALG